MGTENTPAVETPPAIETPPIDDFADAFASLTREPVIAPVVETPPADEPAAVSTIPPAPAAPAVPPAAEVPPAVATPPVGEVPPVVETLEQVRIRELEEQLAAAKAAPAPAAPAAPVVETPPAAPVYTDDEKVLIDKYHEDWPDIAKAESLKRRQEYRDIVSYVFSQVTEMIAPALQYYESNAGRTAYSDIVALVSDYDAVRDKAVAWAQAETQPAYLKAAFGRVISEGSPEEVADLINRFKKETAYVPPVAAPAAPVKGGAVATPAPLSEAARKAAGTLTVVKTSRSVQSEPADPNDFDAAFSEAVGRK